MQKVLIILPALALCACDVRFSPPPSATASASQNTTQWVYAPNFGSNVQMIHAADGPHFLKLIDDQLQELDRRQAALAKEQAEIERERIKLVRVKTNFLGFQRR